MQQYVKTEIYQSNQGGINIDTIEGQTENIKYLFEEINTVEADWKS